MHFWVGGAGGSRTLVQTEASKAFYMLSSSFDCRVVTGEELSYDYLIPVSSDHGSRDKATTSPLFPKPRPKREQATLFGRLLAPKLSLKLPMQRCNRCHLFFLHAVFTECTCGLRHAYLTHLLLSKPIQPQDVKELSYVKFTYKNTKKF